VAAALRVDVTAVGDTGLLLLRVLLSCEFKQARDQLPDEERALVHSLHVAIPAFNSNTQADRRVG
jgi:hypothetical protein